MQTKKKLNKYTTCTKNELHNITTTTKTIYRWTHEPNSLQTRKKSNKWQAHDVRGHNFGPKFFYQNSWKTYTPNSIVDCKTVWIGNSFLIMKTVKMWTPSIKTTTKKKLFFIEIFNGNIYLGFAFPWELLPFLDLYNLYNLICFFFPSFSRSIAFSVHTIFVRFYWRLSGACSHFVIMCPYVFVWFLLDFMLKR